MEMCIVRLIDFSSVHRPRAVNSTITLSSIRWMAFKVLVYMGILMGVFNYEIPLVFIWVLGTCEN